MRGGFFLDREGQIRRGFAIVLFWGLCTVLLLVLGALSGALGVAHDQLEFHARLAMSALLAHVAHARIDPRPERWDPLDPAANRRWLLVAPLGALLPCLPALVALVMGQVTRVPLGPPALGDAAELALPGLSEELLLRGLSLAILCEAFGGLWATLGCGLAFGLLHLHNPHAGLLGVANVALSGLLFGLVVVRSRSVWPAVAAHAAWNLAEGALFGLPVSGLVARGALVPIAIGGPVWLGGGAFGPEGSAILTLALALACGVLLGRIPVRERRA